MAKLKFDHLHLLTRDIHAATAFYRDVLGAEVVGREETDRARVHLTLGGMRVFITDMSSVPSVAAAAPHPHLGLDHIAFEVEGLDEICAAVSARGATLTRQPETLRPGVRLASVQGPDSVRIDLVERSRG